MKLYDTPIQGVPIVEPEKIPGLGEVVIGYELLNEKTAKKYFTKPNPKLMNVPGWASVVLLVICFWPAACVPCFTTCSYSTCQRPVYGYPLVTREFPLEPYITPNISFEQPRDDNPVEKNIETNKE